MASTNSQEPFDAKAELASFYERHFDELLDSCLSASYPNVAWTPLGTLPYEDRRSWTTAGLRVAIQMLLGEDVIKVEQSYYPHVPKTENDPFFGIADIIDSCESALMPDEGILPLLWQDYADEPQKLLPLVLEFRRAQIRMTEAHVRQQNKDFEDYIAFAKKMAVTEERVRLEESIYQHFYLSLRRLRDKTNGLYELVAQKTGDMILATEVIQLKMMEADLLAEVFRINPDADFEQKPPEKPQAGKRFQEAAKEHGLSEREQEIVALVSRGYSNRDIAEMTSLAESTVKNYLSTILTKLDKKNRSQIVVFAAENGYFEEGR